jgi:hypothetical protein
LQAPFVRETRVQTALVRTTLARATLELTAFARTTQSIAQVAPILSRASHGILPRKTPILLVAQWPRGGLRLDWLNRLDQIAHGNLLSVPHRRGGQHNDDASATAAEGRLTFANRRPFIVGQQFIEIDQDR